MRFVNIYNYVFRDNAIFKGIDRPSSNQKKPNSDERQYNEVSDEDREQQEEHNRRLELKLNEHHSKIKTEFEFIADPTNPLRHAFYYMLSSVEAVNKVPIIALKEILYSEEQRLEYSSQLEDMKRKYADKYSILDEMVIKQEFKLLNDKFKYFENDSIQTQEDFIEFFKACKLTADFDECNNSNNNSVAYDHAYKMLVLFGAAHGKGQSIFRNIDKYFTQHGGGAKLIHDGLVQMIPINPPLQDLTGWRAFISKYGYNALSYFQQAPEIEKISGNKAPVSITDAIDAAAKVTYPRANEYPELARLCKLYHIDNTIFDKCLEIEKKRKKQDKLPDVAVNGKDFGFDGYHLVKLPIDDPRAYLLGHITNCCQSMGGDSERCVIDGITREKNGFYVLLKRDKKGDEKAEPIRNGKIDYENFQIVGQAYAWLSMGGNLTLDSFENLRPEIDDPIAVRMLRAFSKKVTEQSEEILRVTIGAGGKTPKKLIEAVLDDPESMAEGYQYGDSKSQALLYFNEIKFRQIINSVTARRKDPSSQQWNDTLLNEESFMSLIHSFASKLYINQLDTLLNNNDAFWKMKGDEAGDNLAVFIRQIKLNKLAINCISFLQQAGILNHYNFHLIVQHEQYVSALYKGLVTLNNAKLLTPENIILLAKESKNAEELACGLVTLSVGKILTPDNISLLAQNSHNAKTLTGGLVLLNNANILTAENSKLLVKNLHPINSLTVWLKILKDKNILTTENFKLLAENSLYAEGIACGLVTVNGANLSTPKNISLLAENSGNAEWLARGLVTLNDANLSTPENISLLAKNSQYAEWLARGLVTLKDANMLTKENIASLSKHNFLPRLVKRLVLLNDAKILTPESFKLVYDDAPSFGTLDIDKIISGLVTLKSANILTASNIELLTQKAGGRVSDFVDGLCILSKANILTTENSDKFADVFRTENFNSVLVLVNDANLLTAENFKLLTETGISYNKYNKFASGIEILNNAKILSIENFGLLIKNMKVALQLAHCLVYMSREKDLARNIKLLTDNAAHAHPLSYGLIDLHKDKMLTDENIKLMSDNPSQASKLSAGLIELNKDKRLTTWNLKLLAVNPGHAGEIAFMLQSFYRLGFLTTDNSKLPFNAATHARELAAWLIILSDARLLTTENCQLFVRRPEDASKLADCLCDFQKRLKKYEKERELNKANYNSFFSPVAAIFGKAFSREVELSAVKKFSEMIIGQNVVFTNDEIKALRQDELGKLLNEYADVLPNSFIEIEKKMLGIRSPEKNSYSK